MPPGWDWHRVCSPVCPSLHEVPLRLPSRVSPAWLLLSLLVAAPAQAEPDGSPTPASTPTETETETEGSPDLAVPVSPEAPHDPAEGDSSPDATPDSQSPDLDTTSEDGSPIPIIEELTYEQWPGLPPAASKIYFAQRRWTISGFGELAYNHTFGNKSRASGDLELYNTNLYRFVIYGAVRATPWLVLFAEAFVEVLHDGNRELEWDAIPEIFADFTIHPAFNVRVGTAQVPIGYINNNDEPIEFFSVNRPEVERVIIPSQWIELGVQVYGKIGPRSHWMLHAFRGNDGRKFYEATWVRRGRHPAFDYFAPAFAFQLQTSPIDHLELSASTVVMESGTRSEIDFDGRTERVRAPTTLTSAWARYESGDLHLMALGVVGTMAQTDKMFDLTEQYGDNGGQVFGRQTYGAYVEVGWDILPLLRGRQERTGRSFFHRANEMKLPLFFRYERLDTHASVDANLERRVGPDAPIIRSNLDVVTVGFNFNTRKNLLFKANYQFRHNRSGIPGITDEGNRFEAGMGFIF